MTPLTSAISRALIHFVWQGSIVGVSLWVVLFGLRKRSPRARYAAGCAALGLMALAPVVTAWVLYAQAVGGASMPLLTAWQAAAIDVGAGAATHAVWLSRLQVWALPIWSIGALAFSLRLVLGYRHAFQLRRRAASAGESALAVVDRLRKVMGVERPIRVLISEMSDSPSVVGWIRPVILLSTATLMGLTPLQLEAILAHEIGHIKRYDYLVNILQMLVETLLFYHPAVWWASKRIRLERELCCDDLAVRFSGNALRYARALTTLEKLRLHTPSVVMASTGGPLLYRIQRLVGVTSKEYGPSRLPALLAMAVGVLCLALNVTWLRAQDAPNVTVDLGGSSIIHRAPVVYPETAVKQGITGSVQLEVKLDSTGNVSDARVLSGPEELRKAALESVLNWHFTRDAARGTRLITINFTGQSKQVQVSEPQSINFLTATVQEGKDVLTLTDGKASFNVFVGENGRQRTEEVKAQAELSRASNELRAEKTTLSRRQELERQMDAVKRELQASGQTPELQEGLENQLVELRKQLEATPFTVRYERAQPIGGLALKGIAVFGLSDSVQNDLISRLPIRVGDLLSSQSIEQTSAAVRAYDEHLRIQFLRTDDGKAELRIVAPNERR